MTDCNKIQANNIACNEISLTEQWKKGELPEGFYYIKVKEVIANYPLLADCVEGLSYTYFLDYEDYVIEVLAPVPSYDELQNMNEAVNECMAANIKLVEQNKQLKELLKECKEMLKKSITYQCMDRSNHYIKKIENDIYEPTLAKINEVLK